MGGKFGQTAVAAIGAIVLTLATVGAAVAPAQVGQASPRSLAAADISGQLLG